MHNGIILTSQEITDLIDDITRLFINDILTGSVVLSITYKSLMALKSHYIIALKGHHAIEQEESIEKRAKFTEEICDQIRFEDLDEKNNPSLS